MCGRYYIPNDDDGDNLRLEHLPLLVKAWF